MRQREGFTLLEMFVVLVMAGIMAAIAIPSIGSMMAATNVQRAAGVIAADMQLAYSLAARQRQPVQITVDVANRIMRVRNVATTAVYSERHFRATSTATAPDRTVERGGEYPVEQMQTSAATRTIFPNGLANGALTITIRAGSKTRIISMTRAGQVRITEP